MALSELTSASAVREAIAEFDQLGRDGFLHKYGFGRAHKYFLEHEGRLDDPKAIAGACGIPPRTRPFRCAWPGVDVRIRKPRKLAEDK
jgi:hypothetical protein